MSWALQRIVFVIFCCLALAAVRAPAAAQTDGAIVPMLWPAEPRLEKPDLSRITSIRFLTDTSYPPFNYLDDGGRLVGFNVDLARAVCEELEVECTMRTRAWDKLMDELAAGRGDAIMASLAVTREARETVDFTDRYYLTPARFAVHNDTAYGEMTPQGLAGRTVGVIAGTAHEEFLKTFFSETTLETFKTRGEARDALKALKVEALFDDGISLVFWINGTISQGCCAMRGGPWIDPRYFGEGAAIAVRKGNEPLRKALNYALKRVYRSGRYEEIFLRYFPLNFY